MDVVNSRSRAEEDRKRNRVDMIDMYGVGRGSGVPHMQN